MPISITVIDILNNEYQLDSLPVGENIEVLFSEQPDLNDVSNHIALVRTESDQDVPNLGDIYVHRLHDSADYSTVDLEFTLKADSSGYVLTINPEEFLMPNANYYLIIGQDLTPTHYLINKTTSFGSSEISIETSSNGSGEDAVFSLVVSAMSNLSNGMHTISVDVSKDGGPVATHNLNIKDNNKLELNDTVSALFNPNVPFLVGETFEITTQAFERLGSSKIQSISTFIDSDVIENVEETSTRISQQNILDFYSNTHWGQEVATPEEVVTKPISAYWNYPNILTIVFDKDIDPASLSIEAFNFDITYAFDNYMLPNMGLFTDEIKYIINVSHKANKAQQIVITIDEDTNGIVPEQDQFLVVIN